MALPRPRKNVPRRRVGRNVQIILADPQVGDVDCLEQPDNSYIVSPRPRVDAPQVAKKTKMNASKKAKKKGSKAAKKSKKKAKKTS